MKKVFSHLFINAIIAAIILALNAWVGFECSVVELCILYICICLFLKK